MSLGLNRLCHPGAPELAISEFTSSSPKSGHVFILLLFSALVIIFQLLTLEGEDSALSFPAPITHAHLSRFLARLPF